MKSFRSVLTRYQFWIVTVITAFLMVAIGIGIQFLLVPPNPPPVPAAVLTPSPPVVVSPKAPLTPPLSPLQPPRSLVNAPQPPAKTETGYQLPPPPQSPLSQTETKFNHLPYSETVQQRLIQVGIYYDRPEFLDKEAAEAFNRMKADAQSNGVDLVVISGFRSVAEQAKLFERQIQRRGSQEAAAKLSAPPGYSEHHTGYALDIGDGQHRDRDLKTVFESSQAYRWLGVYAYQYGFELSFPPNNPQGVSFEPWHWRYVGSPRASQVFTAARR